MYERLLPLGSVVLVKGGNKRLMITGRIQARKGDTKVYDYSACLYPEGIMNSQEMYFFNHDAVDHLYFVGFQDEEELGFRSEKLAKLGELYVDESGRIAQR
jgi:hypothetical protein